MSDTKLEQMFLNLKTEFADLHARIDGLISKYEVLEKQLENQKKGSYRCRKCNKKFESLKKLQKHKNYDKPCIDDFKCEQCE